MKPVTEQANPRTREIDRRSTIEIVTLINDEDRTVAEAVALVLPQVAEAVDRIVECLRNGGRLFYIGTGTSGRLGVLDASECPPTYGVPPDLVRGLIAGGVEALYKSIEAAEDDPVQAARDLEAAGLAVRDVVVGISASGNTLYTMGALAHARQIGAAAIAVTCNPESKMAAAAEVSIAPVVGPEVIAGSSRMKAGTAQKLILNMLSTATMIRLGLVYGNLMANLQPNNAKLVRRACAILAEEMGLSSDAAARLFDEAGRDLRLALVMAATKLPRAAAEALLQTHSNSVRRAIDSL
ncbi:MAG: N-acetylmuramic acid 6-phosphate etherase [Blastocatellia bacterium]